MIEAKLYKKQTDNTIDCLLCPHYCKIKPDKVGICKVRKNISGVLYSLNSDKIVAMSSDPIEKKPLYHFLPASNSYSIASMGCNFSCNFCQNNDISIIKNSNEIYGKNVSGEIIVQEALRSNARSIAYTYTEPTIYYELMKDVILHAKKEGLKNIMVSNGFLSNETIEELLQDIDAINIDIKAFSDTFYKQYCNGALKPVLNTVKKMKEAGIHIEITTLLINGENDKEEEIMDLIKFIINIDPETPWHISRFYPTYKFSNFQPTDIDTIYKFVELAKNMGLKYIYSGNIQDNKYSNTFCPNCKDLLIQRSGYSTDIKGLKTGKCTTCNYKIKGVW